MHLALMAILLWCGGCVSTCTVTDEPIPDSVPTTMHGLSFDQVHRAYCQEAIRAYALRNGNR